MAIGYLFASRNNRNTTNIIKIPIIFIPGLMGSRLTLEGLTWDPDWQITFGRKWFFASFRTKRTALNYKNSCTVMNLNKDKGIGSVASSFYGELLENLAKEKFRAAKTPVYAIGYDWRQCNADSAKAVRKRIREILETENAKRFILVSHSMGGLVSRAMLKGYEDMRVKAAGVIHVVQPVAGAVVLYRRQFTGQRKALDGDDLASKVLNHLYGTDPATAAAMYSVMPGPMQLLPTDHYKEKSSDWLHVDTGEYPQPQVPAQKAPIYSQYISEHSPPGIFNDKVHTKSGTKKTLKEALENAKKFHDYLGTWKLEGKTWAIFSTGLKTDVAIKFRREGGWGEAISNYRVGDLVVLPVQKPEGDGTVPADSASALFENYLELEDAKPDDFKKRQQFSVQGVEHSAVFGNELVYGALKRMIDRCVREVHAQEFMRKM